VLWNISLGDFNLHHHLWDEEHNGHLFTRGNLEKSQVSIDVLAEFNLQMALPKDIPTLQALSTGNHTRPNYIFISSLVAGSVIRCTMIPDKRQVRSDHILVVTEVNRFLEEWVELPCPSFRLADWKGVREILTSRLKGLDTGVEINTPGKLYIQVGELTCTISEIMDAYILKVGLLPNQKQWWSPLLTEKHMELHRLIHRAYN